MTVTLKVSDNTKEKMIEYFIDKKRDKTPAYAVFQAVEADTVITLYNSGKVVFQGVSADIDASMWGQMEQHLNPGKKLEMTNSDKKDKNKDKDKNEIYVDPKIYYSTSIGSDEVGTGDFFGPVVVTACFVKKEQINYLEELGIKDSKKMTDLKIMEVVPKFINLVEYETIILSNTDYNNFYSSDVNMNKIKAIMHNKALFKLKNRTTNYDYIVVDQFAKKDVYFRYLTDAGNVVNDITFLTKAEDKSVSVSCASLISRFVFLKKFNELAKEVGINLPKGASDKVDAAGVEFVNKYGFDKLKDVSKLNFKNTDKIKDLINKNS